MFHLDVCFGQTIAHEKRQVNHPDRFRRETESESAENSRIKLVIPFRTLESLAKIHPVLSID
jgi:hypothetical protein